ncbi:MAG: tetratricopeptide repeat protein [Sandaracinaceae bacterium]|nr:tetratricopeptide repeat protein [Sandaracinaceae bacterium]
MRRAGLCVILVCLCLHPFRLWAQAPSPQSTQELIRRGEAEYEDLRFDEALQTFSAALVRPGNGPEELSKIYYYLALTYLALGRKEEAEGAYRSLLGIKPDSVPGPELSPRFREFFNQVRARWEADGRPGLPPPAPVSIRHQLPKEAPRGTALGLEAQVEDPDRRVGSLVFAYRQGERAVFTRVEAERDPQGNYRVIIPGEAIKPPFFEYYIEALDAKGLPIASRGDVTTPLRILVPGQEGSLIQEPLFWILLGGGTALVVGGAVLIAVLSQSPNATIVFTIDG